MVFSGKSVAFHTLGCKLNFSETSTIARLFYEKGFEKKQFSEAADVYVINTYVTNIHKCNLLIVDECHTIANIESMTFKTVLKRTQFNWVLCLSATLEDKHIQFFKTNNIHEVGNISLQECIDNKWVSQNRILCVPIPFTDNEKIEYKKMKQIFDTHFATFKFDIKLGLSALANKEIRQLIAFENGGLEGNWTEERVMMAALQWNRNMAARKTMLYNLPSKLNAAIYLAKTLQLNTILFGQTNTSADYIAEQLGESCVAYHSKLKAVQKKEAIKKLSDGRTKVTQISSVKALEVGMNIPILELGINYARTSKSLAQKQKNGRSIRFIENKTSYFIELYVPSFIEIDKNKCITEFEKYHSKEKALIEWIKANQIKILNSGIKTT